MLAVPATKPRDRRSFGKKTPYLHRIAESFYRVTQELEELILHESSIPLVQLLLCKLEPVELIQPSQIDAVLSGTFRMGMYGQFVDLGAGDWIEVPAGATHSAEVIGVEAVVSLDAVRN